jgi:hypothetical protein
MATRQPPGRNRVQRTSGTVSFRIIAPCVDSLMVSFRRGRIFRWTPFKLKKRLFAVLLCLAFAWFFYSFTDAVRIVRIARSHGIEMGGTIVTLEPLDRSSSDLGNSAHETYRITLTQEGFQSILSQIRKLDSRYEEVELKSFGFTTDWSGASHSWVSVRGNNLFVIAIVDENVPVIELCSAW